MSEAGKNALFGHDPVLRRNLDDIVLLTSRVKDAQRYANTSNTAGAAGVQALMSGSTFAAGAAAGHGVLGGVGAMVGSAALQTLSAHALASKALTDWILRAPRIGSAKAFDSYIGQLKSIALREPAIANDISQLRDTITQSAPSSPSNPEDDKINFTPGFEKNNGSSAIKPTAQADTSIGTQNNNAGNIRDGDFAKSQPGYAGADDNGFAIFKTPQAGEQAQERLLRDSYLAKGHNTIDKIIERYNPRSDKRNTPEVMRNYKTFVADRLGIGINDKIDASMLGAVAEAQRAFETGDR
jgi:hypothetical protein